MNSLKDNNKEDNILSTPTHENKGTTHSTPEHRDDGYIESFPAEQDYDNTLPGFETPDYKTKDEGFDQVDTDWLNILLKESQGHDDRKEWEVKNYDKVLEHQKHGKFYRDPTVKIEGKNIWWTKDNAKHAGSEWKLYVEVGKELLHYKDVDKYGHFIEGKHKGRVGKVIAKKDLIGKHND